MQQDTLIILFYLKRARTNAKGKCPILCRMTFKKERKQFSTGLFINPENWKAKVQKAIDPSEESIQINNHLSLINQRINKAYLTLKVQRDEFSVEDISETFLNKKIKKEDSVISYFKKYLDKQKKLIGKDIRESTWKKFNYVCSDVESFISKSYNKKDILLTELTPQFLDDFEYYLKTEKEQKQVTINKEIQRFRKPIRIAVAEGYLDKDPFSLHKPGRVKKEVVFLSQDELDKFEKKDFSQPRLQLVKDLFVFCCYTGLAYNEMSKIETKHLEIGFDGNEWIKIVRDKTNKEVAVPLLDKAKNIIKKYQSKDGSDTLFPGISNQKLNSYLKEIALILEIDKRITHHTARKTFASTVLLYNDVPIEVVSEILGHSSIQITQSYYGKVVQKKVSETFIKLKKKVK